MDVRHVTAPPGTAAVSGKEMVFFVESGTDSPPLVTLQHNNYATLSAVYCRPHTYNGKTGVLVHVVFEGDPAGNTLTLSLGQVGISNPDPLNVYALV